MKTEKTEYKKRELYVGIGEVEIYGFNLNRAKSNEFFGFEDKDEDQEIEYTKEVEVKDGEDTKMVNQVTVSVFVIEKRTKTKHKINFYIKEMIAKSKDGLKTQYVNQFGDSTWVDEPSNLTERFTTLVSKDRNDPSLESKCPKEYRMAYSGEAQLLDFLAKWMDFNTFQITNNILLDMKKLFKGNVSEIQEQLENYQDRTLLVAFGVKSKEKDGETKQYQIVSSKFFVQGKFAKNYNNYLKNNFEGLTKTTKYMYNLWAFHKNLTDEQYGFDKEADFLVLDNIRPYVEGESPLATNKAVVEATDSRY